MNAGLLLIRLVFGLMMAAHGSQKLFSWFGGYGIAGTGQFFEALGFRPGSTFAALAGLAEFFGGLLLAFGFATPLAAVLIISVMITAIGSVHLGNGLFAATNGIEVPFLYAASVAGVTFIGPGAFSCDAIFGPMPWTPSVKLAAVAIGVVGGCVNLAIRRPAAQPA